MKQAILITAFKNLAHLLKIIRFFDDPVFEIYIHWDKKMEIDAQSRQEILSHNCVKLFNAVYKVNWGSFNHLRAIIKITEEAYKNKEISYFHLISGQDFPIKSKAQFKSFFSDNCKSYIDSFSVPKKGWADNGGLDRLEYYNLYDVLNGKNHNQNVWIKKVIRIQKKLGIKRDFPKDVALQGGSTWWSLHKSGVSVVLYFLKKNPNFLKRFKHTLCAEEFFFQTILNNPLNTKPFIENNNLRYIDWVARNGNNPAVLDETDYHKLVGSSAFFARKIETPISDKLLELIEEKIN